MAHVITQPCCNDASCVPVCPVDCIHPTPGEAGFATTEALYIDPATCIDCGACVPACPVEAIVRDTDPVARQFLPLAETYFRRHPLPAGIPEIAPPPPLPDPGPGRELRVAIVGSGPAGAYTALEVLAHPSATVTMIDRLPTPWGLVRGGVAPDHPSTKAVTDVFEQAAAAGRFRFHLNVEIGRDLAHGELLAHHDAVVYAHGADSDRRLDIPGEDLPGSASATDFVNWYNGHPDASDLAFDLSGERVVVVGNGNVALDVARVLVTDPDVLARTDIADHALVALRASRVTEVVVLGRRGPAQAACTTPELLGLARLDGVDVHTVAQEVALDPATEALLADHGTHPLVRAKVDTVQALSESHPESHPDGKRRIVLRFLTSPSELLGSAYVTGIRVDRNRLQADEDGTLRPVPTGEQEDLTTSLVLRSVGYRGSALPGLPFDESSGVVPHEDGRVLDARGGEPLPGVYTAGWIKRGPSGGIGTNKKCAQDTVAGLLADHAAGRLPTPSATGFAELIRRRCPEALTVDGWRAIDRAEQALGARDGRPRHKLATYDALLDAARQAEPAES